MLAGVVNDSQILGLSIGERAIRSLEQNLGESDDGIQRCPQLVADDGQKLGLESVCLGQLFDHTPLSGIELGIVHARCNLISQCGEQANLLRGKGVASAALHVYDADYGLADKERDCDRRVGIQQQRRLEMPLFSPHVVDDAWFSRSCGQPHRTVGADQDLEPLLPEVFSLLAGSLTQHGHVSAWIDQIDPHIVKA